MKTLTVNLKERSYRVVVGGGALARSGDILYRQGFRTAPVIVANGTVLRLHGDRLLGALRGAFGPSPLIRIPDGERYKNHQTLLKIYDGLFRARADRRSWILAFGGGVTGDIAGFAAATFMRGIRFVMVPTTLLSQVDSSIGGKTGINVPQGKNLVGAFYQPSAVIADTGVLETLPGRQLRSGLFEVLKCGAIRSRPLLDYIDRRLPDILDRHPGALEHIIVAAAGIKADVVALDETEGGLRMILNYGHTIGHAIEAAGGYRRFTHGEAVAWGMIAALGYGRELGVLGAEETGRLNRLIRKAGRLPAVGGLGPEEVWRALLRDKKFGGGDVRMVLLRGLGEGAVFNGIDARSLRRFLGRFLGGNGDLD